MVAEAEFGQQIVSHRHTKKIPTGYSEVNDWYREVIRDWATDTLFLASHNISAYVERAAKHPAHQQGQKQQDEMKGTPPLIDMDHLVHPEMHDTHSSSSSEVRPRGRTAKKRGQDESGKIKKPPDKTSS